MIWYHDMSPQHGLTWTNDVSTYEPHNLMTRVHKLTPWQAHYMSHDIILHDMTSHKLMKWHHAMTPWQHDMTTQDDSTEPMTWPHRTHKDLSGPQKDPKGTPLMSSSLLEDQTVLEKNARLFTSFHHIHIYSFSFFFLLFNYFLPFSPSLFILSLLISSSPRHKEVFQKTCKRKRCWTR